ncbi:MAG: cadmium transporter ATPase [Thermodesulfobacteriota bacterium]|nr:MAG: cadmium transporter ATPase [Thermodesulfobacteriota bacterium]
MSSIEHDEAYEGKWYAYPPLRNALIAGLITGAAFLMAHPYRVIPQSIEIVIYIIAILLGGYHWGREGIEGLFEEKKIGIDILMIAATAGSAILGMWDEAAFLVFLYGTAEGIEEYTYAKTRGSIRKLLDLAPKEARILRNGDETTIRAEDLMVGDLFIVRPGESIPTDGVIEKGQSSINEAPVTGESIPVEKKEGMKVFAGTINQEGALEIKATTTFYDNTLSKMIHLVEEAQEKKGKAQLFIEKFGNRYTPIVLLVSFLLFVIPILLGWDVSKWAVRAVVLLVAAAPCALVMSTPIAIAAGIGIAGRNGVLIKGGMCLEDLGKIKAVAFDKTGTLTKGSPVVTNVIALYGDEKKLLEIAYSIERLSEHPLAQAIVEKAKSLNLKSCDVMNFESLTGSGIKAALDGETTYIGKPELFKELGFNFEKITSDIDELAQEGKTVILLGTSEKIQGIIALRDEIRTEAKEIISDLHSMGIKVIMLTGDNENTARAISKEVGIDEYKADLKPEDKINAIEKLEQEYGAVAMVGDGVNDAPALARATVGIAMGTAGTDAAIEAADVALMADDITKVSYAIQLGKRAKKIGLQNIVFSLLILIVLIPSALIGIMTVAIAVLFHEVSELLAVANGLRVGLLKKLK